MGLTGARPLESFLFFTRATDRASPRAVTLHSTSKQIARHRERSRAHPERAGDSLVHQGCKPSVEAALERDTQQDHGCIGIQILFPGLMVRTCFPEIEEADEIRPCVVPSMPMLVLLRHTRQPGGMTGKLSQCYSTNITAALQLRHVFGY